MYDLPDNIHNLRQKMAKRTAQFDEDALLRQLGYPKPKERDRARLRYVLSDPALGIFYWPFPFTHSGHDFIRALGQVLGINSIMLNAAIARIEQSADEASKRFIPQIFVDTGFRRTTQPIFALAVCEYQRHIRLDDEILQVYFNMDEARKLQLISEIVREHYTQQKGQLGIWGVISHYVLKLEPDKTLMLNPDGRINKEVDAPVPPKARLLYKNQAMSL